MWVYYSKELYVFRCAYITARNLTSLLKVWVYYNENSFLGVWLFYNKIIQTGPSDFTFHLLNHNASNTTFGQIFHYLLCHIHVTCQFLVNSFLSHSILAIKYISMSILSMPAQTSGERGHWAVYYTCPQSFIKKNIFLFVAFNNFEE